MTPNNRSSQPNLPVILDGGMGRELQRMQAPFKQPEWSALALMQAPDYVSQAHQRFLSAGAEVITTNTYALVPFHLGQEVFDSQGEHLIHLAAQIARRCANRYPEAQVAGCIPPVLGSYRPDLFEAKQAQPLIETLIEHQNSYVDFWLAETISSLAEAQLIAKCVQTTHKPLWVALTIQDEITQNPCLRSGEPLTDVIMQLASLDVTAILFNCSCAEVMESALRTTKQLLNTLPRSKPPLLGAYANSFSPIGALHQANGDCQSIRHDLTPEAYCEFAKSWLNAGASIIGGCCGVSPKHIKALTALKPV